MWGGFDFGSATKQLGALGSQLGEAIQKAKQEVETTIEGFEKGDDYVAPVPTPAAWSVQPPPAEAYSSIPEGTALHPPAESRTTEDVSVVKHEISAPPPAVVPQLESGTEPKPSKPKKKIIKKIVKKVPAPVTSTAAASASVGAHTSDAGGSTPQDDAQHIAQQLSLQPDPQPEPQPQLQKPHQQLQQQATPKLQQEQLAEHPADNGWGLDADGLEQQLDQLAQQQQQQVGQYQQLERHDHKQQQQQQDQLIVQEVPPPVESQPQCRGPVSDSHRDEQSQQPQSHAPAQPLTQQAAQDASVAAPAADRHSQQWVQQDTQQQQQELEVPHSHIKQQPGMLADQPGEQLQAKHRPGQQSQQQETWTGQLEQGWQVEQQGLMLQQQVDANGQQADSQQDMLQAEASADLHVSELHQQQDLLQQQAGHIPAGTAVPDGDNVAVGATVSEAAAEADAGSASATHGTATSQLSEAAPFNGDATEATAGYDDAPCALPQSPQHPEQQQEQEVSVQLHQQLDQQPANGLSSTVPSQHSFHVVTEQQQQQQQQQHCHQPDSHRGVQPSVTTVMEDLQQDRGIEEQQQAQEPLLELAEQHRQQQNQHHQHQHQHQQQQQQDHQAEEPLPPSKQSGLVGALPDAQLCLELQQQLAVREGQLSRAAGRLSELESAVAQLTEAKADLEVVVQQLTEANEQLVLRAAKVSEAELQEIQQEAAGRLAAAERKVFALTKERDALKRAATAASAGDSSTAVEAAQLRGQLQRKEELVAQLMEEGQKLSKRQLDLEGSLKKTRQQLKASEAEREKLAALLAAESAEAEGLRRAKAKAERDLVAAVEAGRQEVEAVRQQAQADMLNTQAEQAAAQAVAAQAATGELAATLKAAEARNAALTESLTELQEALERQRAAADLREEMLRQDLSDVERRAQAAELRHQELSAKLPEATAPLLRQISALQDASSAQAQAWAAAERSLTSRVREAEANAAAAAAREAAAQDALGALQVRVAAAEASAAAAKSAAHEASSRATRAEERLALTQAQLDEQLAAAADTQALITQLRDDLKALETSAARKLDAERSVRRAADEELSRTRAELEALQASTGSSGWGPAAGQHGGPPAMAAPGFKWVLVNEADEAAAAAAGAGGPLSRRLSSFSSQTGASGLGPGMQRLSGLLDEDLAALPGSPAAGGSSSRPGSDAAGLFDPGELFASSTAGLAAPGYTPRAPGVDAASASAASQGYAGALGSPTGSMASSRAAGAAQARMAAARLGGGGTVAEAAVQRLRAALRQKAGECASMEGRVRELEATRDQLASELVKATHSAEQAADAVTRLPQLQAEYQQLEERYAAAVELLGERDEQLEEMAADLADVKHLYKQQIEALVAQLAEEGRPVAGS